MKRYFAIALIGTAALAADDTPKTNFKFTFGSANTAAGFTKVEPTAVYSAETGYGFEPNSAVTATEQAVTSDKQIYFSVTEPEGNYKITATFGDKNAATVTTVKAELRRLMVEKVETAPGKYEKRTF